MAAAGRRFRRDPWLVVGEEDKQAPAGAGMFDRDPQKRLDELIEDDLTGHRLRSLEHRPDIQPLGGRAKGSGGRCRDWGVAEMRMKLFELPHLAERAPAKIAAPRLPQTGVGDRIEAARREEPRGQLVGQTLVLAKTVVTRPSNGLLVQTHCIGVSRFEPRDLGGPPPVLTRKSRWIVFGPLAQLLPVRNQEVAPSGPRGGSTLLMKRRHRH